jgi:hypothetical protein
MFSHITLGTNDWLRARPFWIAVMEMLGHPVMFEREGGIAFGLPAGEDLHRPAVRPAGSARR